MKLIEQLKNTVNSIGVPLLEVSWREIRDRWKERMVPNGWDKMGAEGAKAYLAKYGKGIGKDKLKVFSDYAEFLANFGPGNKDKDLRKSLQDISLAFKDALEVVKSSEEP